MVHYDLPDRYYEMDYTKDFETQFRALQVIEDYNPRFLTLNTEKLRTGTIPYMIK